MTGLKINKESFLKMNEEGQNGLLFENSEKIIELLSGIKFNQKVHYIWLSALSLLLGVSKYLTI